MIKDSVLENWLKISDEPECIYRFNDCCAWPARWIEYAFYVKIELPYYSNRKEADALLKEAGSMEALWSRALQGVATPIGTDPEKARLGDVGIMQTHRFGQIGLIIAAPHQAFYRCERREDEVGVAGGVVRPRNMVQIWRV